MTPAEQAFEWAPTALATMDPRGVIVAANWAFRRLTDCPREGAKVSELLAGGDDALMLAALERTAQVSEVGAEFQLRAGGLSSTWAIRRAEGGLVTCQVSLPDEGPQERASADQSFMRDAAVGVVLCTRDGRITRVNPRFCHMVGYQAEELLGMRFSQLNYPEDAAKVLEQMTRLLSGAQREAVVEKRLVRKNGSLLWTSVSLSLQFDEQQQPHGVLSVVKDIGARKRTEAELRDRDARLEAIFNHAPAEMLLISARPDDNLRVLAVNRPFRTMAAKLGLPDEQDLVGKNAIDLVRRMALSDSVGARLLRRLQRAIASGQTVMEEGSVETPDGPFHAEFAAIPILDEAGRPAYVLSVSRDTTAQRLAEDRLKDALKVKETLLREIHHRVKNNLQLVSSLLSLQLREAGASAAREVLELARSRVHTVALIHESLYRSGNVGELDFLNHARGVVKRLVPMGSPATIELSSNAPRLMLGMQSAVPLGLILNELLTNALKHGGSAGPRASVRCEVEGRVVTLKVDDDGPGFAPGFSIERTPTLGLKIVSALAGQLDGELAIDPGPGAHVRVTFPIPADADPG